MGTLLFGGLGVGRNRSLDGGLDTLLRLLKLSVPCDCIAVELVFLPIKLAEGLFGLTGLTTDLAKVSLDNPFDYAGCHGALPSSPLRILASTWPLNRLS